MMWEAGNKWRGPSDGGAATCHFRYILDTFLVFEFSPFTFFSVTVFGLAMVKDANN